MKFLCMIWWGGATSGIPKHQAYEQLESTAQNGPDVSVKRLSGGAFRKVLFRKNLRGILRLISHLLSGAIIYPESGLMLRPPRELST